MIKAKWREGFSFYKGVDAQKVADEIYSISKEPTAAEIVEKARSSKTELHKCFEWDDSKAAEKYRLHQAYDVIHHLVIVENEVPKDRPEIKVFYKTDNSGQYKRTELVVQDQDEYSKLLEQAYRELKAFKEKYACLKELQEIFDLI